MSSDLNQYHMKQKQKVGQKVLSLYLKTLKASTLKLKALPVAFTENNKIHHFAPPPTRALHLFFISADRRKLKSKKKNLPSYCSGKARRKWEDIRLTPSL